MKHEMDQYYEDQEIPLPLPKSEACKFLKSKCVLASKDDPEEGEIEIATFDHGGLRFYFTSRQEVTEEETVECDLGHNHRIKKLVNHTYESFSISRKDAKNLLTWLKMRVK